MSVAHMARFTSRPLQKRITSNFVSRLTDETASSTHPFVVHSQRMKAPR